MKPFHVLVLVLSLAACDKDQIEATCQQAAINKCGDKKSLKASACRGAVMSICVKKLCDMPFNQCAGVDQSDALCSANDCNEPDDADYPDDLTWGYCAPEGYYDCDDQECTLIEGECPV